MARPLLHGIRPREALDRLALASAFASGVLGSVALKLWDAEPLAVALWPVLVLFCYLAACLATRVLHIEPETVGDNCYYLGFLFTLASLAATLYRIVGPEGRVTDEAFIAQVISGFGVALTSTIVGVFLRVMLMQMRPDIVARDREARADLARGARDFHTAITQATRRLSLLSVEAAQHAAERNAKIDAITEAHAAAVEALLARRMEAGEAALKAAADRLAEEIGARVARQAEEAAGRLSEAAGRLSESLAGLAAIQAEALPRIEGAQQGLEGALAGWRGAVEAQQGALAKAAEGVEAQSAALARALGEAEVAIASAARRLDDAMAGPGRSRRGWLPFARSRAGRAARAPAE